MVNRWFDTSALLSVGQLIETPQSTARKDINELAILTPSLILPSGLSIDKAGRSVRIASLLEEGLREVSLPHRPNLMHGCTFAGKAFVVPRAVYKVVIKL